MKIPKRKRLNDLLIVIVLLVLAVVVTIGIQPNFLIATFLFFGLPSAYLAYRKPSNLPKASLAALLLGCVWGFSFDYIAEFNNAWGWSTNTNLSLPVEFFGVVSLDILIWYFLWVFLTVLFYEYFIEYDFSKKLSRNFGISLTIGLILIPIVVWISRVAPSLFTFSHAYLVLGALTLIPFTLILIRRPAIVPKVIEIIPFFICLYLAFELVALQTSLWSFPGTYIGSVTVFGLSFPFEEMLFWIIISSAATATYHEFFIDDGK